MRKHSAVNPRKSGDPIESGVLLDSRYHKLDVSDLCIKNIHIGQAQYGW